MARGPSIGPRHNMMSPTTGLDESHIATWITVAVTDDLPLVTESDDTFAHVQQ